MRAYFWITWQPILITFAPTCFRRVFGPEPVIAPEPFHVIAIACPLWAMAQAHDLSPALHITPNLKKVQTYPNSVKKQQAHFLLEVDT